MPPDPDQKSTLFLRDSAIVHNTVSKNSPPGGRVVVCPHDVNNPIFRAPQQHGVGIGKLSR